MFAAGCTGPTSVQIQNPLPTQSPTSSIAQWSDLQFPRVPVPNLLRLPGGRPLGVAIFAEGHRSGKSGAELQQHWPAWVWLNNQSPGSPDHADCVEVFVLGRSLRRSGGKGLLTSVARS